ncbi:MAG TPA: hypothetical protein EYQ74_03105 [Planctomycetes bacterium]|nr:hypothetical protein [Planctomycetota bacterium]HIK59104.1 hypothetical protein [Planctomycetota bacterium]
MQTHSGLPAFRLSVFLLGGAILGGCAGPGAASYNLDQLLRPEGGFHYVAALQSDFEYHVGQMVGNDWLKTASSLEDPEPIESPTELTLEYLLTLADAESGPASPWIAATQVRQFARYALLCPSELARERCFIELAGHAERLGIEGPITEFPSPATPAQVGDALAELVGVHRLAKEGEAARSEPADLSSAYAKACEGCSELTLDIHGGWRLLDMVTQLQSRTPPGSAGLEELASLSISIQRRLLSLSLTLGVNDPAPHARAAAWGAGHAAYGAPFLAEALVSLVMPARSREGGVARTQRFGLHAQAGGDEALFLRTFELVRLHGLPADLPGADPQALRNSQLFVLLQVSHDFSAYGERARASAMQTLGAVTGVADLGLRKEAWEEWWATELARQSGENRKL